MGSQAGLALRELVPSLAEGIRCSCLVVHHHGNLATSSLFCRTSGTCLPIPSFSHIYGLPCARQCSRSSGYISGCKRTNVPVLTELTSELTVVLIISACLRLLLIQAFFLLPSNGGFWLWPPWATTPPHREDVVSSVGKSVDQLFFG